MKKLLTILAVLALLIALPAASLADSDSNIVYFDSTLMALLSSGDLTIDSLTVTDETRALVAVLLSTDFKIVQEDYEFDFIKPIYVAKDATSIVVAMGGTDGYVAVSYETYPTVSTGYLLLPGADSAWVKDAMDQSSTSVWEVSLSSYLTAIEKVSEIFSN